MYMFFSVQNSLSSKAVDGLHTTVIKLKLNGKGQQDP